LSLQENTGGKDRRLVASGRHGDDVAFESRQFQRAVRFLVSCPQFHAAERPHHRFSAIEFRRFEFLVLHSNFDALEALAGAGLIALLKRILALRVPGANPTGTARQSHALTASISLSAHLPYDAGMRLLLVEDDARIARFVAKGLREQTYAVDVAGTGDDALYQAAINTYDLVILDVMIPGATVSKYAASFEIRPAACPS